MNKEELFKNLSLIGLEPHILDEIGSTNSYAKSVCLRDGIIVVAEHQSAGRGRFQRCWFSDKGKNALFTIVKNLDVEVYNTFLVNFYTSYIIIETLKDYVGNSSALSVKWPNDVLISSKKVAGVLSEISDGKFIIGVGINVNQNHFPEELQHRATSLFLEDGRETPVEEVIISFAKKFVTMLNLLKMPDEVMKRWRSNFHYLGKVVTYSVYGTDNRLAVVIDIDNDGALVVNEGGIIKKYYSGEITNFRG